MREKERERVRERGGEREREKERERERESKRDRDRNRETDRKKERQREIDCERKKGGFERASYRDNTNCIRCLCQKSEINGAETYVPENFASSNNLSYCIRFFLHARASL